jgi:hypothetical protein
MRVEQPSAARQKPMSHLQSHGSGDPVSPSAMSELSGCHRSECLGGLNGLHRPQAAGVDLVWEPLSNQAIVAALLGNRLDQYQTRRHERLPCPAGGRHLLCLFPIPNQVAAGELLHTLGQAKASGVS